MKHIIKEIKFNREKNKRKLMYRKNHPIHKSNDLSDGLNSILLGIIGALIGIWGNQFFYKQNKTFDAKVELKKEQLKIQYPHLNRILSFTHTYEIASKTIYQFNYPIYYSLKQNGDTVYVGSPTEPTKVDTIKVNVPSFIYDSIKRKHLLEDLEEIRNNRSYVHFSVWEKVQRLISFLNDNPIPISEKLFESTWKNPITTHKWGLIIDELFKETNHVMHSLEYHLD